MVEVICKTCGGHNRFESLLGEMSCDYCGVQIELDDERGRFANLYSKADDAWDRKDFDEALSLYEQIVEEDNTQSEAHWGAALCRYGVAYVRDVFSDVMMPTCNRVNRTSILDDKNYLSAIKYAGPNARRSYESRAHEIDRISKQFLKIVEKEKPYDVFISYKKTGFDNRLTEDSQFARKLYQYLTNQGIKVFFAEETLESVAGQMYEPYIFAALTSAKVMVLMGSRRDYFEAPWVKNEWTRYLKQMQSDPSKALIPAYIHCKPEDALPMRLNMMQALDATGPAFCETVESIVKKKMKAAPQAAKAGNLSILAERYATKEKVGKVVAELDCEPELAAEVLIIQQGKTDDAIRYIASSDDYRKKMWVCTECGQKNTHDVCANSKCGISKADSINIKRMRDDAARQMQEQKRKEEEQRRKEYERSAEAKRIRAAKRSAAMSKFVSTLVILGILGGIGFGVYKLYTGVIQPAIHNGATADSFYSPEILQTYCGTYSATAGNGKAIITFEECDENGGVTGIFEFVIDGQYGKYKITGTITDRKNNGKLKMIMTPGAWIIQPKDYITLNEMELDFSDDFMSFSGSRNSLRASAGGNSEFDISTVADLQKLSNSDGLYILKNDIDLEGQSWTPIDGFTGTLVGNGFTIKNMTIDASSSNVGFFSTLSGLVSDLTFENASVTVSGREENVGILCGTLDGIISGISVSGTVTAETCTSVGGIVGLVRASGNYVITSLESSADVVGNIRVGGIIGTVNTNYSSYSDYNVTVTDMKNSGNITANEMIAGGIVGGMYSYGNGEITLDASQLHNTGDVTSIMGVGGIFGFGESDSTSSCMTDCTSNANIVGESYVGGLAGVLEAITIDNCRNEGSSITATGYSAEEGIKYAYVGGYVGYGYIVNNCSNSVPINYTAGGRYVGGIAGYVEVNYTYKMSKLENTATITGCDYVGGIFGGIYQNNTSYSDYSVSLAAFENTGAITATGNYAGGIAGYLCVIGNGDVTLYATDMVNSGSVDCKQFAGGIFGYAQTDSTDSYLQDCSSCSSITADCYVGAIAGQLVLITINDCSNEGSTITANGYISIDSTKYAYVGGYVGYGYLANNCTNTVDITYSAGGRYVGGIIGFSDATPTYSMNGLSNTATISGHNYVGGIFGGINSTSNSYSNYSVNLSNFSNSGKITGSANYVGGIVGYFLAEGNGSITLYASDMVNTATITGEKYVGGIFGYGKTDSTNSSMISVTAIGKVNGSSYAKSTIGRVENITVE